MANFENGGFLSKITWAYSVLKLAEKNARKREIIETDFNIKILSHDADEKELTAQKEKTIAQFNMDNAENIADVENIKLFFTKYKDFSALMSAFIDNMNSLDISSESSYVACALSNFWEHHFIIDGIYCCTMEGFLQSLKFQQIEIQRSVCQMKGRQAKFAGKKSKWYKNQILYWNGKNFKRDSQEYQDLLDRAFGALSENTDFQKILLASGNMTLVHSIGKSDIRRTVLTEDEFCQRLTKIRERLKAAYDKERI